MRPRVLRLVPVFIVLFLATRPAAGQGVTGAVEGTVKDETGAVTPGATVELSSTAFSGTRLTTSDARGYYRFLRLPPGVYVVRFSLAGFTTSSHPDVELRSGQTARVDASLTRGALEVSVTVQALNPIVDVVSNTVQTVATQEYIKTIPNSRHYYDLPKLVLGSVQNKADVEGATSSATE